MNLTVSVRIFEGLRIEAALEAVLSRAFGEQVCGQTPGKRGGRDPTIIGGCNRGSHRLDLFLHESINLLQQFFVDWSAGKGIRPGKRNGREFVPVSAMRSEPMLVPAAASATATPANG